MKTSRFTAYTPPLSNLRKAKKPQRIDAKRRTKQAWKQKMDRFDNDFHEFILEEITYCRSKAVRELYVKFAQIHWEYKGPVEKYSGLINRFKVLVRTGEIDADILCGFMNTDIPEAFRNAIFKAAFEAKPAIMSESDVEDAAKFFGSQEFLAPPIMVAIAENAPELINVKSFEIIVKTSEWYSGRAKRHEWMGDDSYGGDFIIEILAEKPKLLAKLLAQYEVSEDMIKWWIYEKHEANQSQWEHEADTLHSVISASVIRQRTLEAPKDQSTGLAKVAQGTTTPVIYGDTTIDSMFVRDETSFETSMLEWMDKVGPPKQGSYITIKVLLELANELDGKNHKNALRTLKLIAKHDINLLLTAAPGLGDRFGELAGLGYRKEVDIKLIIKNKEEYGFENLFTAWAIGKQELSPTLAREIKELEWIMEREFAPVVFKLVSAITDKKSHWSFADIKRLWNAPLFQIKPMQRQDYIDQILALNHQDKIKLLQIAEYPGKLTTWFAKPQCSRRLKYVLENFGFFHFLSVTQIHERLALINKFPMALTDEAFRDVLYAYNQAGFPGIFKHRIANGQFELGNISHGIRQLSQQFIDEYHALLPETLLLLGKGEARMLRNFHFTKKDGTKSYDYYLSNFISTLITLFELDLCELSEASINRGFKRLSTRFHSDTHPDEQSQAIFKMLGTAKAILLKFEYELRTGHQHPDLLALQLPDGE